MAGVKGETRRGMFRRVMLLPCLLCLIGGCGTAMAQEARLPAVSCGNAAVDSAPATQANTVAKNSAPANLQKDLGLVEAASFPELKTKVVKTRTFDSSADYFRTRFSVSRFLLWRPMHYFVEMNPRIEHAGPSAESVCAILAHELVHISRMSDGNRLHLFGLVRLGSGGYTARFERSADLEAIRRGYGPGLISFREWVYKNIPANAVKRKKRNYFSPEEIEAILEATKGRPELFAYWNKHVPLNLEQIESSAKDAR